MNYSNHNLRTDLLEWRNRLANTTYTQFGLQIQFLLNNLDSNKQISGLLQEASMKYPFDKGDLEIIPIKAEFENEAHQAAYSYQFIKGIVDQIGHYKIQNAGILDRGPFNPTKSHIIDNYFTPIFDFLHDRLDKSSSVIYLLEKYKKRTEWFTKKELFADYANANKNYEELLDADLRSFLFDQGIDYPFSTPSSASGRADIVGQIDTEDPLIVEVKIVDETKGYGKERVKSGFTQIVRYANDYNKDVGYLVIFNMGRAELNLKFNENTHRFPPSLIFNNKVFYFIVINAGETPSASKSGPVKELVITEDELTKKDGE